MPPLDHVHSFLEQMGASRVPPGSGTRPGESLWHLGDAIIAVCELPDGAIRIDEVVIASRSLAHVLDAIGNVEARRIAHVDELNPTPRRPDPIPPPTPRGG